MAKSRDDVKFTFDTEGFKTAMRSMARGVASFAQYTKEQVKGASKSLLGFFRKRSKENKESLKNVKSISKGVFNALAKFAIIGTIIVAAFKLAKNAINKFVPEVSRTFSIVNNIIMKNLLFPLRKELIPILQRVLDWARKNRGMFTKWGSVLVNVFKVVVQFFKAAKNIVMTFFKAIDRSTNRMFSKVGSITDFVNLMLFKMAAFLIGVEVLIGPLADRIGTIVGKIINSLKAFFKGLVGDINFQDIISQLGNIGNAFSNLTEMIFGNENAWEDFGKAMAKLNDLILMPLLVTLESLLLIMQGLLDPDLKSGWKKFKEGFATPFKRGKERKQERVRKEIEAVTQGALTDGAGGEGIAQDILNKQSKTSINLINGDMNVSVTEGDAKKAGENFVEGMEGKIKNILQDDLILQGSR